MVIALKGGAFALFQRCFPNLTELMKNAQSVPNISTPTKISKATVIGTPNPFLYFVPNNSIRIIIGIKTLQYENITPAFAVAKIGVVKSNKKQITEPIINVSENCNVSAPIVLRKIKYAVTIGRTVPNVKIIVNSGTDFVYSCFANGNERTNFADKSRKPNAIVIVIKKIAGTNMKNFGNK